MSEGLRRDYEIGPQIGVGRFGVVRRCTSPESGEPYAVKTIDKAALIAAGDPVDRECLDREAKLTRLAGAGNPNVVQIHAVYEDEDRLHLVLDLCPTSLYDLIAARAPIPEPEVAAVMAALAAAIAGSHRRGVAHRDVKPENVLFDLAGELRLADFGSAAEIGDPMSGIVGTPYYVAPEVVAGREYGEKVDVWSAGVVMYVMLAGVPPFYGESAVETFEAVMRANLRFPTRIFRDVSPSAKDLMRRMLCKDVSRRFSAEQVLRHPWITSGGGSRLEG